MAEFCFDHCTVREQRNCARAEEYALLDHVIEGFIFTVTGWAW